MYQAIQGFLTGFFKQHLLFPHDSSKLDNNVMNLITLSIKYLRSLPTRSISNKVTVLFSNSWVLSATACLYPYNCLLPPGFCHWNKGCCFRMLPSSLVPFQCLTPVTLQSIQLCTIALIVSKKCCLILLFNNRTSDFEVNTWLPKIRLIFSWV